MGTETLASKQDLSQVLSIEMETNRDFALCSMLKDLDTQSLGGKELDSVGGGGGRQHYRALQAEAECVEGSGVKMKL